MKHAGPRTFARIPWLLGELRERSVLREARPGVFTLKSRAFLHFHDDPAGVFADVRLGDTFVRLDVTTRSGQADLLDRIDDRLAALEERSEGRTTARRRRRARRDAR